MRATPGEQLALGGDGGRVRPAGAHLHNFVRCENLHLPELVYVVERVVTEATQYAGTA